MIYLLYGEDTTKAREKMHSIVDSMCAKKPDASLFKMDSYNFNHAQLEEFVMSAGLFVQKYIVVLDNVFENKEYKEVVVGKVKEIGASENVFVILEGKLDKKTVTKIEKKAEKVQEFAKNTLSEKKKDFNIFSLTDAIGRRDRKKAWVLFQQATAGGVSPENIHGTIFWGVKSILLATGARTAKEAGLNPFVFSKSVLFSKNFKKGELENISSKLISIYHEARRGGTELGVALEIFILSV
ncbi:hypothetical protein MNBD_BACTEROID05-735 [hydrothermal vent metagenome]|uniref:DNA polymerase III delta N-terminal domain-containing protein n=1 Tax=hydrothermal vent metagenome TaxID=652676 RepID=A0A3B0TY23_9ZZZZ